MLGPESVESCWTTAAAKAHKNISFMRMLNFTSVLLELLVKQRAQQVVRDYYTCAMTPGRRGKDWMAGAWVTRGSVFSIRTE